MTCEPITGGQSCTASTETRPVFGSDFQTRPAGTTVITMRSMVSVRTNRGTESTPGCPSGRLLSHHVVACFARPELAGLADYIQEVRRPVDRVWQLNYQPWFTDH